MTNLVLIVLTNVAACSMVEWSDDLIIWQPYCYTYYAVRRWEIRKSQMPEGAEFWKYRREGE